MDTLETRSSNPPAPIRVFVVEDQIKILKAQLKLLEACPELTVVGTALSGETGLEEIRRARPDVLLLDLGLPRMSGIEVTRVLKAELPEGDPHLHHLRRRQSAEAVRAAPRYLPGRHADKTSRPYIHEAR